MERGRVVLFRAPSKPPPGVPAKGLGVTETLLRHNPALQADAPDVLERYFCELYSSAVSDPNRIQTDRASFSFANVGKKFKLIEDGFTHPIVVPWKEGAERLAGLRRALAAGKAPGRGLYRALQAYTVCVHGNAYTKAVKDGAIEIVCDGIEALRESHFNHYSDDYGLVIGDDVGFGRPEGFIA